jgi:endoglucanase
MEEVGGQGAKTAAYQVSPTHAIAVDVSFAHTPDAKKEKCGELKKGPMIGYAPILSRAMTEGMIAAAKANDIPFQNEVMGGRTGTNADSIATSRGGVACSLLSIPQKYMHTPIETVAVEDVENTGRLIAAYLIANWGGNR